MTQELCLRDDANGDVVSDTSVISPEKIATKDRRITMRLSERLFDELMNRAEATNKNASLILRNALIKELYASDYRACK